MTSPVTARRRIAGASIGNLGELYDFFLFGFSAPVLAVHFFPKSNPTAAMLGTFAVYALAFFARPLGGLLFGFLGDRKGRINVLTTTVLLMGACTTAAGLLPTFESVGVLAPVLLVVCRLGQGLSLGGESSGSYAYVIESAPEGRRARWVGFAACTAFLPAALVGILVLAVRSGMGEAAYVGWGWRIPFLIGGVLGAAGFWLRKRLDDPEEFTEAAIEKAADDPLRTAARPRIKSMLLVTLLGSAHAVVSYLLLGFMYTFLVQVAGLGHTAALLSNAGAVAVLALLFPVFGALADRVGRKPLLLSGTALLAVVAYPAFKLASSGTVAGACLGQVLLVLAAAPCVAAGFVAQLELFPTAVRCTGHAISSNLGNAIFGGTAPLIAAALVTGFGSPLAPAFYGVAIGVFAFLVVLVLPETRRYRLRDASARRDEERKVLQAEG
ncbi:MHS family MFS transporter [Amycolatopsis acidicola]|uniref:MHS family MFS transporter n=1 Tax=Amycolatopsis acidicola TaxID=2596893 RepID=A0A5N0VAB3_9PSEU|nr:MFS transporter [Amycolatopsis acidicola]KAA9163306.1 MHS family MFS transporter [Amycolatopsis acidicola]